MRNLIVILILIPFSGFSQGELDVTEYFENGNKKYELFHFDGGIKVSEWYEDGQLRASNIYTEGEPVDSLFTVFYEDGTLKAAGPASKQATNSGEWETYYKSGQVFSIGSYGFFETVNAGDPGNVVYIPYKNGFWRYYYETGEILAEGSYDPSPKIGKPGKNTRESVQEVQWNDWKYFLKDGTETKYEKVAELLENKYQ